MELLDLPIYKNPSKFNALIDTARELLEAIRANPSTDPAPDSPVALVFDPRVARKLNAFVPFRSMEPRGVFHTWDAVEALLDGWRELAKLAVTPCVSSWVVR